MENRSHLSQERPPKELIIVFAFESYTMNPVEMVFLGTASAAPTETRNLASMAIRAEGEWLLFDCPEGAQQQMLRGNVSYMKIQHIFLTHLHLDHVLGIPGLIATMQMHARIHPLYIYCPLNWKKKLVQILNLAPKTDFEVIIKEVTRGNVYTTPDFRVSTVPVKHEIDCNAYIFEQTGKRGEFQRKKALELKIPEGPLWAKLTKGEKVKVDGKTVSPEQVMDYSKSKPGIKISYVVDTRPVKTYYSAIANSTVLIHEATFLEKERERAKETGHSTAQQAGKIASETNAQQLYLTHFSARQKNLEPVENEARLEFGNVSCARDLEKITLKSED